MDDFIDFTLKRAAGMASYVPVTVCNDGFQISVQASQLHYCTPRNDTGTWTHVECGFPSAEPEFIMEYCEDPQNPTKTVYSYVPIELVEKLLAEHGGKVTA